ncbi:MAG: glycoside hydrolase family 3 C-terminal domain-containing protein [Prevotella sp.]
MKKYITTVLFACFGIMYADAQVFPYQNPALSPKERAADLCARLTLEEKAIVMIDRSKAIPRLGVPEFAWWSEALHGVGRNGFSTVFPSCIGMAASFDDVLVERIFTAVSDEARAKNTVQRKSGHVTKYQGLSFWTPNINIFRDPRWGRGQETYGEDPYMNSCFGQAVVRGLQGPEGHKYRKLYACAKHFAVHSGPEKTRHNVNIEDVSPRDLWETYLPAFKDLVQKGGVKEVMCAYQRFEGDPCCGSNRLLQQILRDEWRFDGLVVSDCGAIGDFWRPGRHGVSADAVSATAKAVISGTDVECGKTYLDLPNAVKSGLITEEQIDVSVRRLLEGRFELGDFDADSLVEWTKIPESVVACKEHKDLARLMACEQMVLLHNRNNTLPLDKNASGIMVMGPNAADSTMLWGIYFGKPTHSVTVLEGIEAKIGKVAYDKACDITEMTVTEYKTGKSTEAADGSTTLNMDVMSSRTNTIADILSKAADAKTIIFVGGISPNLEREEAKTDKAGFDNGDRTTIELPEVQRNILRALHEAGKKIVFVNCSGSAVALAPELETCDAILQAWYPGEQGGHAVADVLFGDYNPSGKLPVTFYRDDSQLPSFDDYSMSNRTYRYFKGEPLFPFGYGLSYTSFAINNAKYDADKGQIAVEVANTGKVKGAEVVQVYVKKLSDKEGPIKSLRAFSRVELQPGESRNITIPLPYDSFELWDAATNTMRVVPGKHEIYVGNSSDDSNMHVLKYNLREAKNKSMK